jgi:purine-binding chemotaxis protein CheW
MSELFLILRIAGERLAISSAHVDAVVEVDSIIPVPRAADHVLGLAALRSRIFTVIDPLAALGLGRSTGSTPFDAVVVRCDGHLYALRVDSVEDAIELEGEIGELRAPLAPGWSNAARGVVEANGDLLLLLDAHALVAGPAMKAARAA